MRRFSFLNNCIVLLDYRDIARLPLLAGHFRGCSSNGCYSSTKLSRQPSEILKITTLRSLECIARSTLWLLLHSIPWPPSYGFLSGSRHWSTKPRSAQGRLPHQAAAWRTYATLVQETFLRVPLGSARRRGRRSQGFECFSPSQSLFQIIGDCREDDHKSYHANPFPPFDNKKGIHLTAFL